MKSRTLPFLIFSAAVGLLLGWQMKTSGGFGKAVSSEGEVGGSSRKGATMPVAADGVMQAPGQSSDTAMTLHALPAEGLYDRMALFLLEAEAGDFPVFYDEFQKRTDRTDHLNELLFIAWTRVDPEAAIATSRGTEDLNRAYWAWAGHDPSAALASATNRGEGIRDAVRGIGEFHPEWLQANWDLIPENLQEVAIQGLVTWPNTQNPEISLRLLHGSKSDSFAKIGILSQSNDQTLLALARQDPAHAYELVQELTGGSHHFHKSHKRTFLDHFLASVNRHEPALLGEIATFVKSPVDQNQIQLAQFQSLLRDDPASAKAMIENTPASWLKEDIEVIYANHLLAGDPDRGYDHAVHLITNGIAEFHRHTLVEAEGRSTMSYNPISGSGQLISNLLDHDAPTLLNELMPETVVEEGWMRKKTAFDTASRIWAQQDVVGYAEWLREQKDHPSVYRNGVSSIVNILENKGEFEAGIEWAQSAEDTSGLSRNRLQGLYFKWLRRDREAAVAWRLSDKFAGNSDDFPIPSVPQPE